MIKMLYGVRDSFTKFLVPFIILLIAEAFLFSLVITISCVIMLLFGILVEICRSRCLLLLR